MASNIQDEETDKQISEQISCESTSTCEHCIGDLEEKTGMDSETGLPVVNEKFDAISASDELFKVSRMASLKRKVKEKIERGIAFKSLWVININYSSPPVAIQNIRNSPVYYKNVLLRKFDEFEIPSLFKKILLNTDHLLNEDISFQSYLSPPIEITKEEQAKALQKFNVKRNSCMSKPQNLEQNPCAIYVISVSNYAQKKLTESMGITEHFQSGPLKFFEEKICLKINLNYILDDFPHLSLQFCPAPEERFYLDLSRFPHKRILKILKGESQESIEYVDEPPFGEDLGEKWARDVYWQPKIIPQNLLENGFIHKNMLKIHIIIEPLYPLITVFASNDGVLYWIIENYSKKLQNERCGFTECLHSAYFYTHETGYRVKVRLYLNGAGPATGSHMSIFLDFLIGQFDDSLPSTLSEFPHETTFTVLDQSDVKMKQNISRTEVNTRGFGSGDFFYDFCRQVNLQDEIHLKNDTLKLLIMVKPIQTARCSSWAYPFVAPPKPPVPFRISKTHL